MKQPRQSRISVQGAAIAILREDEREYISLTDMAKHFGEDTLIYGWMRNRNTVEYLGIWETIHNSSFKGNEFETFRAQSGLNSFNLTPKKWIDATGAVGIQSRAGRHGGGTFAHPDIAFEFGAWLSPEFKLYLIKEFQRLKQEEAERQSLEWNLNRALSKLNYRIHTDAIKEYLLPPHLSKKQESFVYADEADLLNVALFGTTAKEWRIANPSLDGNVRDYASAAQLVVMVNLESTNALLIRNGMSQLDRLRTLREVATQQLRSLSKISLKALDNAPSLPLAEQKEDDGS